MQWLDRWGDITAGDELSYIDNLSTETFQHCLMMLSLHVVIILVLMIALFLIRKSEATQMQRTTS